MIERRTFLLGSGAAVTGLSVPPPGPRRTPPSTDWLPPKWRELGFPSRRWVKIVFVPTGERYKDIYCLDSEYIAPQVKKFSWTCRDYKNNEWEWLHPMLMDLLFVLHWKYNKEEIHVISGYRTPGSASGLERAALNEQHSLGKALDIRIPETDNALVAENLGKFVYGGVSAFPTLNFVHLDCGPLSISVEKLSTRVPRQEEVKLKKTKGIYAVPVLLNRTAEMEFMVDSGASDVSVPPDVLLALIRTGTLDKADFVGSGVYGLADGSKVRSSRFLIREMILGNVVMRDIQASVGAAGSPLLLGQSFLSNFGSWTVDNQRHMLVLRAKQP